MTTLKYKSLGSYCLHSLGSVLTALPPAIIFSILTWSYYAVVFVVCRNNIAKGFPVSVYILPYHLNFILFVWSFWQSVRSTIPRIPKEFHLTAAETKYFIELETEKERWIFVRHLILNKKLPIHTYNQKGNPQFCDTCFLIKPDRTHHCSNCKRCVPKMDHHCPWINNCVGYHNHKYFTLFVFYGVLYCLSCFVSTLPYFLKFVEGQHEVSASGLHVFMLSVISIIFLCALAILLTFHVFLIIRNKSTLEHFQPPKFYDPNYIHKFDLGWKQNFVAVFGPKIIFWPFPVFTSQGDGFTFPLQQSADNDRIGLLCNLEDDLS